MEFDRGVTRGGTKVWKLHPCAALSLARATLVNFGRPGAHFCYRRRVSSRQDLPLKRALPSPTISLQGRNKESTAYYHRSILLTRPDDRRPREDVPPFSFLLIARTSASLILEKVIETRSAEVAKTGWLEYHPERRRWLGAFFLLSFLFRGSVRSVAIPVDIHGVSKK